MNKQLLTEIQNAIKDTVSDNKIGVAFSGGVDSTLIAKILKDIGYNVHIFNNINYFYRIKLTKCNVNHVGGKKANRRGIWYIIRTT